MTTQTNLLDRAFSEAREQLTRAISAHQELIKGGYTQSDPYVLLFETTQYQINYGGPASTTESQTAFRSVAGQLPGYGPDLLPDLPDQAVPDRQAPPTRTPLSPGKPKEPPRDSQTIGGSASILGGGSGSGSGGGGGGSFTGSAGSVGGIRSPLNP